jgi:hypothetical protein
MKVVDEERGRHELMQGRRAPMDRRARTLKLLPSRHALHLEVDHSQLSQDFSDQKRRQIRISHLEWDVKMKTYPAKLTHSVRRVFGLLPGLMAASIHHMPVRVISTIRPGRRPNRHGVFGYWVLGLFSPIGGHVIGVSDLG